MERAAASDEIRKMFAAQRQLGVDWMSEALEKVYLDIFSSQRSFDAGPGGDSPFGGGIEGKVGICTFEKEELRAAKATCTFEYFKLLRDMKHIRIASADDAPRALDAEQREILSSAALQSPSLSCGQMRKKLALGADAYFNSLYYGDKSREAADQRKCFGISTYFDLFRL